MWRKRMNHYGKRGLKRTMFFAFILSVILVSFVITLQVMHASSITSFPSLQVTTPYPTYPTDYPLDKQTLEAKLRQDRLAATLTMFPTGPAAWSFRPNTETPGP